MIWVYAICDRPELPPPRRRGLAQAPLDAIREGALLAVITRHGRPVGEPAPDALWAHERVVERLMTERTVLPMRFGSVVEDEPALHELLAARQEAFVAALARVEGCVELGVRVLETAPGTSAATPPVAPVNGREYLLARMRDGQRSDGLHDPLAALAVDARRQLARSADEVLRSSYLVERQVVPRFRAAVERLQRAHPEVAILCTGPWPPYSFVDVPRAHPAPVQPAPAPL
jgi:hypothetical protein